MSPKGYKDTISKMFFFLPHKNVQTCHTSHKIMIKK